MVVSKLFASSSLSGTEIRRSPDWVFFNTFWSKKSKLGNTSSFFVGLNSVLISLSLVASMVSAVLIKCAFRSESSGSDSINLISSASISSLLVNWVILSR